jgi:hypothetical protein
MLKLVECVEPGDREEGSESDSGDDESGSGDDESDPDSIGALMFGDMWVRFNMAFTIHANTMTCEVSARPRLLPGIILVTAGPARKVLEAIVGAIPYMFGKARRYHPDMRHAPTGLVIEVKSWKILAWHMAKVRHTKIIKGPWPEWSCADNIHVC